MLLSESPYLISSLSLAAEADLRVFEFFYKVGKVLSGHAHRALFEHFRLYFPFNGYLPVRCEQGKHVVFRRQLDAFEYRVGRFRTACLYRLHDRVRQLYSFAYDLHNDPPKKYLSPFAGRYLFKFLF